MRNKLYIVTGNIDYGGATDTWPIAYFISRKQAQIYIDYLIYLETEEHYYASLGNNIHYTIETETLNVKADKLIEANKAVT